MRDYREFVDRIKAAARGRWDEVLSAIADIDREALDGRNHPCPRCGGRDRFRLIDAEEGALLCNQCFKTGNGDGIAAVQWALKVTFPEACWRIAEHLGIDDDPHAGGKTTRNPKPPTTNPSRREIVAEHDYRNESGELIFQVLRYRPKAFRQRRPAEGGGWDWKVKGVRSVPYRLPELLAADPSKIVFVPEGEKDVDNLFAIGCTATCNAGGAEKWTVDHARYFLGRRVAILPHNDDKGRKHADRVAKSLIGIASSTKVVELAGLPEKGDVSDWLDARDGAEPEALAQQLVALVDAAEEWQPDEVGSDSEFGPVLTCLADVEPRPINWLWFGRIAVGRITLIVGMPGAGKSFATCDFAARISTGTPWPDGAECPKGSVILISAEDDPADTIRPRLDAHHADVSKVHLLSAVTRLDEKGKAEEILFTLADRQALEEALQRTPDCKLVVIDPIGSYLGSGTDAHRDNEVRGVLAPIAAIAERYGVSVLMIAHRRKSAGTIADDTALGSRAFTGIARAVWHLTIDVDDPKRRLLLPGKNNLAASQPGLAFTIFGEPARIAWEADPIELTADDALAREGESGREKNSALNEAVNWLRAALANGPRTGKDIKDAAEEAGIAGRTLERARSALKIETGPVGFGMPWAWRLPTASVRQESQEYAKKESLADSEEFGELCSDSDGSAENNAPDA